MRYLVRTTLIAASLGLGCVMSQTARADEVVVEKKVTTTSPSGVVVIENEATRSFKLQGRTETYVAPPNTDLKSISGKEVSLHLNPDGSVTKVETKTTHMQ